MWGKNECAQMRPSVLQRSAQFAGALRQAGYWLGKVCDEVMMDSLAEEFNGPSLVTGVPQR